MALRGLKITWVCIAILFISCAIILLLNLKIVHFFYFQNTFPFVSTFRQTDDIRKKRRKHFVEQGSLRCLVYGSLDEFWIFIVIFIHFLCNNFIIKFKNSTFLLFPNHFSFCFAEQG